MSCTAFSGHITLPPFYHQESNYNISETLKTFIRSYELIEMKMWQPFDNIFPNFTQIKLPRKLKEIKQISMGTLLSELSEVDMHMEPMLQTSVWDILCFILILVIILLIILCCCRKRIRRIVKIVRSRRSTKGETRGRELPTEPVRQTAALTVEMVPVNLGDDGNVSRNVGKTNSEPPQPYDEQKFDIKSMYPKLHNPNN